MVCGGRAAQAVALVALVLLAAAPAADARKKKRKAKKKRGSGLDKDADVAVHVDDSTWESYRAEHGEFFAMFFHPTCGACKQAKPAFKQAARDSVGVVDFALVECNDENHEVCSELGINQLPQFLLFGDSGDPSRDVMKYEGELSAFKLRENVRKHFVSGYVTAVTPFVNKPLWGKRSHEVVFMDEEHWAQWTAKQDYYFVFYYTAWCSHCKQARADFAAASRLTSVPMVAMDCGLHTVVCKNSTVSKYPTFMMYDATGDEVTQEEYDGRRSAKAFLGWVSHKADTEWDGERYDELQASHEAAQRGWGKQNAHVLHAHEGGWQRMKRAYEHMLVVFYSSANKTQESYLARHAAAKTSQYLLDAKHGKRESYRKKANLTEAEFAKKEEDDYELKVSHTYSAEVVAVDCALNPRMCASLAEKDITLPAWYVYARGKGRMKYPDGPYAPYLRDWYMKFVDQNWRWQMPRFGADMKWGDDVVPEGGKVVTLTDDHFETVRQINQGGLFVMFYTEWCGPCKKAKPEFAKASVMPLGTKRSTKFAAVDCSKHALACHKAGVQGFPGFALFDWSVSHEKKCAGGDGFFPNEFYYSGHSPYYGDYTEKAFRNFVLEKGNHTYYDESYGADTFVNEELWGEGESGKVTFIDDKHWAWWKANNERFLIMFYKPRAKPFRKAKPHYARASESKRHSMPFVAVDCEQQIQLCTDHKIERYPSFMFYNKTRRLNYLFREGRTEPAFVQFARHMSKPWTNQPQWHVAENNLGSGNVTWVSDYDWDWYQRNNGEFLALFYAPWCKASKSQYKPFTELSLDPTLGVPTVAVDCTYTNSTCRSTGMETFPAYRFVKNGKIMPYEGSKGKVALKNYVWKYTNPALVPTTFKNTADWDDMSGDVVFMTDEWYERWGAANDQRFVVMFYAPWCGHCSEAKPGFSGASSVSAVPFVAVDAEANALTKDAYNVTEFPSFFFVDGNMDAPQDISDELGTRGRADFVRWLGKSGLKSENKGATTQRGLWGSQSGDVQFMLESGFKDFSRQNTAFLAMFYAPWCGHCKKAKTPYGQASKRVAMPLTAIDCTDAKSLCSRFKVNSYPTFLFFRSGMPSPYKGGRQESDFVKFAQANFHADDHPAIAPAATATTGGVAATATTGGVTIEILDDKDDAKAQAADAEPEEDDDAALEHFDL